MPSKLLCGRGNCSEVGHHSCSRCHKISYCSELCQKRHWKRHKKDCKSRTKKKICANVLCTKSAHLYCSRCRKISYCSDYCQKKNWKSHRKVCKLSLKHRRRCQSGDCDRNAQLLCSECQLIAYCSDECQKNHLTVHALECGNFETQDICSNCFSSANADFTCDACRSVHYCSSECQIMHAAMGHKDLCVPYVKANVCGNYECDKPAHLACSRCSGIHYCSEVCQRSHWKVHKSECLPEISLTRCNNIDCDKPAHLHCSRCNKMNYCSIECQTSHWIFHKDKCSSLEMIEKKLNPIHRCEYDNCNKSSKSICSRCRKVYYCSEKCQRKHFKTHRRFCVSATDVVTVDRDEPEFVRKRLDKGEEQLNIMVNYLRKSGLSNLPVLEDEYQSIYPLDIDGYNIVKVIARRAELLDVEERGTIELRDPITQQDTAFRWGKLCEELELFLSNKPRLGDIYLAPYETELQFEHNWQYQKCPSYAMPRLFSGQTVIDIGCVDFGILLYSDIHGCEEMKEMKVIDNDNGNNNASEGKNANDDANGDDVNPLRFYGYGGNVFSVCKTRVLVHMLQDRDVSIQSIVEIFVSSLWSEKTLKDFERAIRSLFEQKQEPLVSSLLQHWILELRYPLSKHKAIETWRAKCRRLDTIDAYNFKFRADRVLLTNYVLTGALYDGVHGSIVMFNNPKYIQDHMPFFSALSALPNSFWFSLEEQQIDLKPITDLVCISLRSTHSLNMCCLFCLYIIALFSFTSYLFFVV